MSVFERLKPLISEKLGTSVEDIKLESSFKDDLGADSLDVVEFIMELEDEFDIEVPDEDAEKLSTVGEVVTYVEGKLK